MGEIVSQDGGEFVIKPDGIYTYAHYYEHPEFGRKVIMVGMNHVGDKKYYEEVKKILEPPEIILFEGCMHPSPEKEIPDEDFQKEAEEDFRKMNSEVVDEAFFPAIRTYFMVTQQYFKDLVSESSQFDVTESRWEAGDEEKFDFSSEEKMKEGLNRLSVFRKKAVVEYVKNVLKRVENNQFSKKEWGDGFIFLWSDEALMDILQGAIGRPRDEMVFRKFDKIVLEKNPQSIGIKFGAAHIQYQRKLLERRGYQHKYSMELCNTAF